MSALRDFAEFVKQTAAGSNGDLNSRTPTTPVTQSEPPLNGQVSSPTKPPAGPPHTPVLQWITISPSDVSIPAGGRQQFTATGTFSSFDSPGFDKDVTTAVAWYTTNDEVITIDDKGLATAGSKPGQAEVAAADASGVDASVKVTVTAKDDDGSVGVANEDTKEPPNLLSIRIIPGFASIATGGKQQFRAKGVYSDFSTRDFTKSVAWTSSDLNLLSILDGGIASAKTSEGNPDITATDPETGKSETIKVTVTTPDKVVVLKSITIDPADASVNAGGTVDYVATGIYSDGTKRFVTGEVAWSASKPDLVTFDPGLFFAKTQPGVSETVVITATDETSGVSKSTNLTLQAEDQKTDVTRPPKKKGPPVQSLTISPGDVSINVGESKQFKATGTYFDGSSEDITKEVTWWCEDTDVLSINGGVATALRPGRIVEIMATDKASDVSAAARVAVNDENGVSPRPKGAKPILQSITLGPPFTTLGVGEQREFSARAKYSDGSGKDVTQLVAWSSADDKLVSIGKAGVVTALAVAEDVEIRATDPETLVMGVAKVSVVAADEPEPSTSFTAIVEPANTKLFSGQQVQFHVTYRDADGKEFDKTELSQWKSSDEHVVTIDKRGLATAQRKEGDATIYVDNQFFGKGSTTVTVIAVKSIAVTPDNPRVVFGGQQHQFLATATLSDGTTSDLTGTVEWSSTAPNVISIDKSGFATAQGLGNAAIKATDKGAGVSGSTNVTIVPTGKGALKSKVQILVRDSNKNPVPDDLVVHAKFSSPEGDSPVVVEGKTDSGAVEFKNLLLMKEGHVLLQCGDSNLQVVNYVLPPDGFVTFEAVLKENKDIEAVQVK